MRAPVIRVAMIVIVMMMARLDLQGELEAGMDMDMDMSMIMTMGRPKGIKKGRERAGVRGDRGVPMHMKKCRRPGVEVLNEGIKEIRECGYDANQRGMRVLMRR